MTHGPNVHVSARDRIKISLASIAWFMLALLFLLGVPVLLELPASMVGGLLLASALLAVAAATVMRHLKWSQPGRRPKTYLLCWIASVLLLVAAVGIPVMALSFRVQSDPVIVPQATLTNGEKTVVFQGMVHIGTESFYKSVVYDLEAALAAGYRLYYEGIQPADTDGDRWFSDHLADGKDLGLSYRAMAAACGLQFQHDYFALLSDDMQARPERHLAADVTTAELKAEFERLKRTDPGFAAALRTQPTSGAAGNLTSRPGFVARLIEWHRKGTPGQQRLAGIVCRGAFSIALGDEADGPADPMDRVTLDFRNERLAARIAADPYGKLYVTYGTRHLSGLLQALKARDPRWKMTTIKWMRAVAAPEVFDKEL